MTITASQLRANVYRVLDEVLETGTPVEIERRGHRLRIVPAEPLGRLERLVRRPRYLKVDPESIVHLDWSDEWRP
jgi:prevent-host-death family protein